MRAVVLFAPLLLVGCASGDYVASRGDFDVCRLTMGGPHAAFADAEARRRGLDCRQYYGAIQGQQQRENAAVQQYLAPRPSAFPRPQTCQSYRVGNSVETVCQ